MAVRAVPPPPEQQHAHDQALLSQLAPYLHSTLLENYLKKLPKLRDNNVLLLWEAFSQRLDSAQSASITQAVCCLADNDP